MGYLPSLCGLVLTSLVVTSLALTYRQAPRRERRSGPRESKKLLDDVLVGLNKATVFFSEDYSSINVDGLYGIRVAQGTIMQSLQRCSSPNTECPSGVIAQMEKLNRSFDTMAEKAIPYIQSGDPEYFKAFSKTIDAPYLIEPGRSTLPEASAGSETSYDEEAGDRCLSSLMGGWEENGQSVPVCTVDEDCINLMTKPNQARYSITHQLLYFIIAEKNGCTKKLDEALNVIGLGGMKLFERQLCSHIYSEVKAETEGGNVDEDTQDLFLEQSMLCGVIGFSEFSTPALIRMTLRWQTSIGCFSMSRDALEEAKEILSLEKQMRAENKEKAKEKTRLLQMLEEEERNIKSPSGWTGRKLMREQIMKNGCLSHKSGLGIAVLGVHQRNLLQEISNVDN